MAAAWRRLYGVICFVVPARDPEPGDETLDSAHRKVAAGASMIAARNKGPSPVGVLGDPVTDGHVAAADDRCAHKIDLARLAQHVVVVGERRVDAPTVGRWSRLRGITPPAIGGGRSTAGAILRVRSGAGPGRCRTATRAPASADGFPSLAP